VDHESEYVEYVQARLPTLHRTAYLLCGDRHLADDVVQATITALYVNWGRASRADNLDAYVHRMLVRKFIDEKRRSWARVRLMSSTPEPPPGPPDDGAEHRDAIVSALARLPRGQRAVLVLRYFCDLSVEEAAVALGCSTGNVKSQTSRGLAALRPLLETAMSGGLA
jgi:RNA polymerase sigma-70 factor (sigma-E family)